MKINGWLRLWIVVSVIWVAFFSVEELSPVITEPISGVGILPYDYSSRLGKTAKSQLCEVLVDKNCWQLEMPSRAVIQLKSTVTEEAAKDTAQEIHRLSIENEYYLKRNRIIMALKLVFIPPLIVLALGLAVAWVWRGFAREK